MAVLVVVEGIDGCGKSAVARLVAEKLANDSVNAYQVDKKSIGSVPPQVARRAKVLRRLIWQSDSAEDPLNAIHWVLLIASWYSAIEHVQPALAPANDRIVVVDGWWYRNIAKTIVRSGADEAWLESLFAPVIRPDSVFLLDVDPSVAWSRRGAFSHAELGRWDGYFGDERSSFCLYQSRIRDELRRMAECRGWTRVEPGSSESVASLAEGIVQGLRSQMPAPSVPAENYG